MVMGLNRNVVVRLIENMHKILPKWLELIQNSFLTDDMKEAYERLIADRLERLEPSK
jgi:serine/threonine-protein kinase HipA